MQSTPVYVDYAVLCTGGWSSSLTLSSPATAMCTGYLALYKVPDHSQSCSLLSKLPEPARACERIGLKLF